MGIPNNEFHSTRNIKDQWNDIPVALPGRLDLYNMPVNIPDSIVYYAIEEKRFEVGMPGMSVSRYWQMRLKRRAGFNCPYHSKANSSL